MSIVAELEDIEEVFRKTGDDILIINDFNGITESEKSVMISRIIAKHESNVMDSIPRCNCGAMSGAEKKGETCPKCFGTVSLHLEEDIKPVIWMRSPEGVEKIMNVIAWHMMETTFELDKRFSFLQWITNTKIPSKPPIYRAGSRIIDPCADFLAAGFRRGYNNFVQNFDAINDWLLEYFYKLKDGRNAEKLREFAEMIQRNRNKLFSTHYPFPNRIMFILENVGMGQFADTITAPSLNSMLLLMSIDTNPDMRQSDKENKLARAIAGQASFTENHTRANMAGKTGFFRTRLYASRVNFSFRGIISSITGVHDYEDIVLPWIHCIGIFEIDLISKLRFKGHTSVQAMNRVTDAVTRYDPLIAQCLDELIAEAGPNGVAITWCRNPSLMIGSLQCYNLKSYKKDISDQSPAFSILCVSEFNADFDGDGMGGARMISGDMAKYVEVLRPHRTVLDVNNPRRITSGPMIPKTIVANISQWVHDGENYNDPSLMLAYL